MWGGGGDGGGGSEEMWGREMTRGEREMSVGIKLRAASGNFS